MTAKPISVLLDFPSAMISQALLTSGLIPIAPGISFPDPRGINPHKAPDLDEITPWSVSLWVPSPPAAITRYPSLAHWLANSIAC